MAHKTLVSGTEYTITSGKTQVGGTEYSISSGKTKVGGTEYNLSLSSSKVIGDLSVGDSVFFEVGVSSKANTEFIIVQKGLPSSDYDASCDGVWVMSKNALTATAFSTASNGSHNSYMDSTLHSFINKTWLNVYAPERVRNSVLEVKIPFWYGYTIDGELRTGEMGLVAKVFAPSLRELGDTGSTTYLPAIGASLEYFNGSGAAGRICLSNSTGNATKYWTRTPSSFVTESIPSGSGACYIGETGSATHGLVTTVCATRPTFILPYDFEI